MKIEVNGKIYASLNEVPEPERRLTEDAAKAALAGRDGDGLPDLLKGDDPKSRLVVRTTIRINGKTYGSAAEMPPAARAIHDQAMKTATSFAAGPVAPQGPPTVQAPEPAVTPGGISLGPFLGWIIAAAAIALVIVLLLR